MQVKSMPGITFTKSGLTRDNSGLRELSTLPGTQKHFTLISPRLQQSPLENSWLLTNNVSLISLKHKGHVAAAESQQSSVKLGFGGGSGQIS